VHALCTPQLGLPPSGKMEQSDNVEGGLGMREPRAAHRAPKAYSYSGTRDYSRRGWTLVQLAAAMAIAAILVVAAIPAYQASRIKAYISEARYVAREWTVASSAYFGQERSWQGATDQSVGWTSPNSRAWNYGPHMYGPPGYEAEAWFIAKLRSGGSSCGNGDGGPGANLIGGWPLFGTGEAAAGVVAPPEDGGGGGSGGCDPDYMLILDSASGRISECGALLHKPCGPRSALITGGIGSSGLPPSAPRNLTVLAEYNSAISVGWDPADRADSYIVQWRPQGYPSWDWAWDHSGTTSYTITWLPQEAVYEIRVVAENSYGQAASSPITATNIARPPFPPTFLTVGNFPESPGGNPLQASAMLQWYDYADGELGYRVEVRAYGGGAWTLSQNLPPNSIFGTASPIPEGTPYEARVLSYNSYGSSPSRTAYLFFDWFNALRPWVDTSAFTRTSLGSEWGLAGTRTDGQPWQSALPGPHLTRVVVRAKVTLKVTGNPVSLTKAWVSVRGSALSGAPTAGIHLYTAADGQTCNGSPAVGVYLVFSDAGYSYCARLADTPGVGQSLSFNVAVSSNGTNPATYIVFVNGVQMVARTSSYSSAPDGPVTIGYQRSSSNVEVFFSKVSYLSPQWTGGIE
jgi:type II secretory pathway pseudopilin PulG